jgi:putative hemolysin
MKAKRTARGDGGLRKLGGMSIGSELAVILGLTLLNAFFSGAEIALISVRKSRLEELAEKRQRSARAALALRRNPEQLLAAVQVGITVVGATAGAFGGAVLERPVAAALERIGAGAWAEQIALAIVVAGISFLSIVIGELVPKSLALQASERVALFVAPPLLAFARLVKPVVWFLTAASNLVLRPFNDRTTFSEGRLTAEEIRDLMHEATVAGTLDAATGEIATRAIELGKLRVQAVMIPRSRITWISSTTSAEQIRRILQEKTHTRYPVHGATQEQVLGYVTARELYAQLLAGEVDVSKIVREVPLFPEQAAAIDALRALQTSRSQIGLVFDESGSISGLVSVEDISEELVGEIFAEHEVPEVAVREEGPGTFLVRGSTPIHEVNRATHFELPEDPRWSTLAGLLIQIAGTFPERGEHLQMEGGVEAEVLEAIDRRITLVRLRTTEHERHDGSVGSV